jgi:NhaP-type Na+/H+ or K+/H+ antiporter
MKNTKIMLATVTTFILTVIFVNTIVWYLEDTWTFKECFAHGATIGFSLILMDTSNIRWSRRR